MTHKSWQWRQRRSHYDETLSGAAERIMRMAEKEQDHRMAWESTALHSGARERFVGLGLGFAALSGCIIAATFLALKGNVEVPVALVGAPLLIAIGMFFRGKRDK